MPNFDASYAHPLSSPTSEPSQDPSQSLSSTTLSETQSIGRSDSADANSVASDGTVTLTHRRISRRRSESDLSHPSYADGANISSWRPYQARPASPPLNKANARELYTSQASADGSDRPDNSHQRKRPRLWVPTAAERAQQAIAQEPPSKIKKTTEDDNNADLPRQSLPANNQPSYSEDDTFASMSSNP